MGTDRSSTRSDLYRCRYNGYTYHLRILVMPLPWFAHRDAVERENGCTTIPIAPDHTPAVKCP